MATVKKIEQSIATLIMVIIYLSIFLGGSIYIYVYIHIYTDIEVSQVIGVALNPP